MTTPQLHHTLGHDPAAGEANIRTVGDTAHLTGSGPFATILKTVGA